MDDSQVLGQAADIPPQHRHISNHGNVNVRGAAKCLGLDRDVVSMVAKSDPSPTFTSYDL